MSSSCSWMPCWDLSIAFPASVTSLTLSIVCSKNSSNHDGKTRKLSWIQSGYSDWDSSLFIFLTIHWDSRDMWQLFVGISDYLAVRMLPASIESRILERLCRFCALEFLDSNPIWSSLQQSSTSTELEYLPTGIYWKSYDLASRLHRTAQHLHKSTLKCTPTTASNTEIACRC